MKIGWQKLSTSKKVAMAGEQIPNIHNLKEKRLILAGSFRSSEWAPKPRGTVEESCKPLALKKQRRAREEGARGPERYTQSHPQDRPKSGSLRPVKLKVKINMVFS